MISTTQMLYCLVTAGVYLLVLSIVLEFVCRKLKLRAAIPTELIEESGEASVASFEYGINNAIPHSRGGELLCPGNTISDGFVTLDFINAGKINNFVGFIGLNTGNGRGSMDSFWYKNDDALTPPRG